MYKTKLQEFCQKKSWELPKYTTTTQKNGTRHVPSYTASVSVHDQVFETTPEEFTTIKEAQNTAARKAFDHFNVPPPDASAPPTTPPPVAAPPPVSPLPSIPPGVYKNRLREYAQKKGLLCPSYETVSSGVSHRPIFESTVTIGTDTFKGDETKTKKQAEMNAAKVAYFALTERDAATNSTMVSTITECPVAENPLQNIQTTTNEGSDPPAKRAKVSTETIEIQHWKHWNTVVIPRELDKKATAMDHSD